MIFVFATVPVVVFKQGFRGFSPNPWFKRLLYCQFLTRGMPVVFSLTIVGLLRNTDFVFIYMYLMILSCFYLLDFHSEIDVIKIIKCLHIFLIQLAMAGMAPENVRKETILSLKRLRTDYIDLYLIHHPVSISVSMFYSGQKF